MTSVAESQLDTATAPLSLSGSGAGPYGSFMYTGSDAVALTFDDGPHPDWTGKVLDLLSQHAAKATFCVVGELASQYPTIVQRIVGEGHSICNHSWEHSFSLGENSVREIRDDLRRTNAAIRRAAGEPDLQIAYYRQPGGRWTERVASVATSEGMRPLHWAVDPRDWDRGATPEQIRNVAMSAAPGDIVLLHDGASNQEEMFPVLEDLLREAQLRGYRLKPL